MVPTPCGSLTVVKPCPARQVKPKVLALLPVAAACWLSRQNLFERMFPPLARPGYVPAAAATFVEPGELVLAVQIQGDAVAYPLRQIAYHHVVEDVVGETPLIVTY